MKKKLISLALIVIMMFSLIGCNYQMVDLQYTFNYAIIKLQNGDVVEGEVQSWMDFEYGEQLQVKIDDVVYLTNSINCTLIYK